MALRLTCHWEGYPKVRLSYASTFFLFFFFCGRSSSSSPPDLFQLLDTPLFPLSVNAFSDAKTLMLTHRTQSTPNT